MSTRQLVLPPEYNLLTNPGFEYDSRAAGPYGSGPAFDGWMGYVNAGALVMDRIASTIGSPGQSVRLVNTGAAGGANALYMRIDGWQQLPGQLVTLALTVKATVNALCYVELWWQSGPFANSAYNVGTTEQRLFCTGLVPAGATMVQPTVRFGTISGTVEVNDATLVLGERPAAFVPLEPAVDRARCQRQYEKHGTGFGMLSQSYQTAGNDGGTWHSFATAKGGVPTMTKAGIWAVANCAQPRVEFPTPDGYMMRATVAATGAFWFYASDFSTMFTTAEWNP